MGRLPHRACPPPRCAPPGLAGPERRVSCGVGVLNCCCDGSASGCEVQRIKLRDCQSSMGRRPTSRRHGCQSQAQAGFGAKARRQQDTMTTSPGMQRPLWVSHGLAATWLPNSVTSSVFIWGPRGPGYAER